jgi:hypothetical protein
LEKLSQGSYRIQFFTTLVASTATKCSVVAPSHTSLIGENLLDTTPLPTHHLAFAVAALLGVCSVDKKQVKSYCSIFHCYLVKFV